MSTLDIIVRLQASLPVLAPTENQTYLTRVFHLEDREFNYRLSEYLGKTKSPRLRAFSYCIQCKRSGNWIVHIPLKCDYRSRNASYFAFNTGFIRYCNTVFLPVLMCTVDIMPGMIGSFLCVPVKVPLLVRTCTR